MTIEVRQLVIKSVVGDDHAVQSHPGGQADGAPAPATRDDMERLREEIIAECQALLDLRLRELTER